MNNLKFIDLFAGIGGFHLAFKEEGFKCVFASEIDQKARDTYNWNFRKKYPEIVDIAFNDNIQTQNLKQIPDHSILCAGFPCQPFSIAGKQKGFEDLGRGDLIFMILKILHLKQPDIVFLENVKNLVSHNKGDTYKYIKNCLAEKGYYVKEQVLNTMEFGNLPQNRERLYIIGFRNYNFYNSFTFPNKIPLVRTVSSILEKEKVDDYFYYNNKPLYTKLNSRDLKEGVVYQWRRTYLRENKKGVCPTLTANMGTGGHNVPLIKDSFGIRKLTPRECLRLQGFPEKFEFPTTVSYGNQYKQIGNSVSIPVIKRIIEKIKEVINNKND